MNGLTNKAIADKITWTGVIDVGYFFRTKLIKIKIIITSN